MNTTLALTLLTQLLVLEDIAINTRTPEGRWQMLQDWLEENPQWEKQVNKWIKLTPAEALTSLKNYVAEQTKVPSRMLDKFITPAIEQRVINSIQTIQTCYRERKQENRKEIA